MPRAGLVALLLTACPRQPPPPERPAPLAADAAVEHASPGDAAPVPMPADASVVARACEPYDPANPACAGDPRACLDGAYCKCPAPPDAENPACWAVMPCPQVPDRRIRACWPRWPACTNPDRRDVDNPNCPPTTLRARVIAFQATPAGEGVVTLGIGSDQGISVRWTATLLRGDSDAPLPGGDIVLIRVARTRTIGKLRVREEIVTANPRVQLSVP